VGSAPGARCREARARGRRRRGRRGRRSAGAIVTSCQARRCLSGNKACRESSTSGASTGRASPYVWPASHPATPPLARRVSSARAPSTGTLPPHLRPASHPATPPRRPASQFGLGRQHRDPTPAPSASLPPLPLSPGASRHASSGLGCQLRARPHVWPASHLAIPPFRPAIAAWEVRPRVPAPGAAPRHRLASLPPGHAPLPDESRHGFPRSHGPPKDIANRQGVNIRLTFLSDCRAPGPPSGETSLHADSVPDDRAVHCEDYSCMAGAAGSAEIRHFWLEGDGLNRVERRGGRADLASIADYLKRPSKK
jgi:hypothetical protein